MIKHPEIGPRQTVDRAKHPTLGEGRLVHRNGPAFFVADSGEWCAITDYEYGVGYVDGKKIAFDTDGRLRGDRHYRAYVHTRGVGWLVGSVGGDCHRHRFDGDDGTTFELRANTLWSGLPEHKGCKQKTADAQRAARKAGWMSMSDDMTTISWCHESDRGTALAFLEHRNEPAPPKAKKDRARKTSGPLPDFANMTREQIQAWEKGA